MEERKVTAKDIRMGKRLKKLRKHIGITQEELAVKTKLSTTFIGLLEIGRRRASLKTLQKIASAIGVKVKDLLPY